MYLSDVASASSRPAARSLTVRSCEGQSTMAASKRRDEDRANPGAGEQQLTAICTSSLPSLKGVSQ